VGQAPPYRPVVHVRVANTESAHVDAVQTQHREGARVGAHRLAAMVAAGLLQAQVLLEALAGAIAPVVEVARDDDRRVTGYHAIEALDDRADLVAPAALVQRKV